MTKKQKKENENIRYCSYCGARIEPVLIGAEVRVEHFAFNDVYKAPISTRFDKKTGKRQYVRKYKCPNSTRFFNKHDNYIVNEIITL